MSVCTAITSRSRSMTCSWTTTPGTSRRTPPTAGGRQRSVCDNIDPLLGALLAHRDAFGWINHTYRHLNLDAVSQAEIEAENQGNIDWAAGVGIDLEPGALVTGAHSGLANLAAVPPRPENPGMAAALRAQGIRYIAC